MGACCLDVDVVFSIMLPATKQTTKSKYFQTKWVSSIVSGVACGIFRFQPMQTRYGVYYVFGDKSHAK